MAVKVNYIVKVTDAKMADIMNALKAAGINVISVLEVHREESQPAA